MPILPNNLTPELLPRTRYFVYVRESWEDDWVYVRYLEPQECEHLIAPGIGTATFIYHFGNIKREGFATFQAYGRSSIVNWYVQIRIQRTGFDPVVFWTGIITSSDETYDKDNFSAGLQKYVAHELSWILTREVITTSFVAAGPTFPGQFSDTVLQKVLTFNRLDPRGLQALGNRSDPVDFGVDGDTTWVFHNDPRSEPSVWSAEHVIDYLMHFFTPQPLINDKGGPTFFYSGDETLSELIDVWDFDSSNVWDALNILINRRRGMSFHCVLQDDDRVEIVPFTVSNEPLAFGGGFQLPANNNVWHVALPTTPPYSHLIADFTVAATPVYDKFIVEGQPILVTATYSAMEETPDINDKTVLSPADPTLRPAWDEDLETEYLGLDLGDDVETAAARSSQRYAGVFRRFSVFGRADDPLWMGNVTHVGNPEQQHSVIPNPFSDGSVTFETGAAAVAEGDLPYLFDLHFERTIPLVTDTDYTDGLPGTDLFAQHPKEFRPVYALIWDQISEDRVTFLHEASDQFVEVHRVEAVGCQHIGLNVDDKTLAIELNTSPAHYLALGETVEAATVEPELYYKNLILTAAYRSNHRQFVEVTLANTERRDTFRVQVPSAEFWWIVPGTIWGTDGEWVEIIPDNTGGGDFFVLASDFPECIIRNDISILQVVLGSALTWYGKPRVPVQLPIQQVGLYIPLGAILGNIIGVDSTQVCNTLVSGRHTDFISEVTVITTSFDELGFA